MAKPKAEYRRTEIIVTGYGSFPIDMLRYDNCVPLTEKDALLIENTFREGSLDMFSCKSSIRLERFSYDGSKAEADRWASFGWRVMEDTGVSRD